METESSSSSTSSMKKSVIMAMNSPSTTTSSQTGCQLMWPRTFLFFFLFIIFSISSVSSSRTPIPYADHCDSIVPESTPTVPGDFTTFPFRQTITSHYTGGNRILGKKSSQFSFDYEKYLSFRIIKSIYKTKASGVYKIEAYLIFHSPNSYYLPRNSTYGQSYYHHPRDSRLKFLLNGFWSESTGKLCMVGSASCLVSGTLESLSSSNAPNYFEPVSILAFPSMNGYNYTLVSEGFDNGCPGGIEIPQNQSLSLQPRSICSMLSGRFNNFKLEYASKCDSLQNCTPFGGGIGYLPHGMSLNTIQCSEEEQKLRYFVQFSNSSNAWYYQNSNLNATLVGEGSWDTKKNRLCITACRILNVTDSLGNVNVGNCSIRLSLRFPAVWSIRNKSAIVGQIWTNKMVNDSGYFDRITFRSSENEMVGVPGLKYEYTEIERVRKSCPMKNPVKNKGVRYPSGFSYEMRFDMSLKDSKGKYSWGNAVPIFVGDQFYERYRLISPMQEDSIGVVEEASEIVESSVIETNSNYSGPLNISYKISFTPLAGDKLGDGIFPYNFSLSPNGQVEISAEGIYNADTGHLCMVGCKKVGSDIQKSTNDSVDCDILVNFQFPPLNSMKGSVIKGSIQSTRKNTDPLYFKPLNMSSNAYYTC
ncbi:hypothetical protein F0562_010322 [Nyssa sinensis]|uniref:DUF2921 domain-containing protein n=1 Tax=Nyssa sinensis TaxID=561372 RepID=A0A5J5A0S8_9ASTE|nr:hypothetical protein F0562_010322 [Nyssa sinensis]